MWGPEEPSGEGSQKQQLEVGGTPTGLRQRGQRKPVTMGPFRTIRRLQPWQWGVTALTLASSVPSEEESSTCLRPPAGAKAGVKSGKRCELLTGMPAHRARLLRICLSVMGRSARFRSPPLSPTGSPVATLQPFSAEWFKLFYISLAAKYNVISNK